MVNQARLKPHIMSPGGHNQKRSNFIKERVSLDRFKMREPIIFSEQPRHWPNHYSSVQPLNYTSDQNYLMETDNWPEQGTFSNTQALTEKEKEIEHRINRIESFLNQGII